MKKPRPGRKFFQLMHLIKRYYPEYIGDAHTSVTKNNLHKEE